MSEATFVKIVRGQEQRCKPQRHTCDVTADRLERHYEYLYDSLDGRERDDFTHVISILRKMAAEPARG